MLKKDARSRFFEAKQSLTALYENAGKENRALTPEESERVKQYRADMEQAQIEMQIEAGERLSASLAINSEAQKRELRLAFAKQAVEAGRSGVPIQVRAASLIDKADAQPLVALQIGDIIGPLEKGLILDKVGCHIQTGLSDDWLYPVVEAVEATVAGESAAISDSDFDINSVKPTPRRVAISIPVTKTALVMTNEKLFDVVVNNLRMAITRVLNKWMFQGTAIAQDVNGLFVAPTTIMESAASGVISYKDICALVGAVDATGIEPSMTAGFVMTNAMKAELKATLRGSGDRFIIEEDKIDGVPVFVTEYAPAGTVEFGYFNYALVGQFGDMDLTVDPFTLAKKNQVQFTLNSFWDIKQARAQAFGKLTKKA